MITPLRGQHLRWHAVCEARAGRQDKAAFLALLAVTDHYPGGNTQHANSPSPKPVYPQCLHLERFRAGAHRSSNDGQEVRHPMQSINQA